MWYIRYVSISGVSFNKESRVHTTESELKRVKSEAQVKTAAVYSAEVIFSNFLSCCYVFALLC